MEIDTRGVQCAGVSFTDALKEKYLKYIEEAIGCKIKYISVGPERESIIIRK